MIMASKQQLEQNPVAHRRRKVYLVHSWKQLTSTVSAPRNDWSSWSKSGKAYRRRRKRSRSRTHNATSWIEGSTIWIETVPPAFLGKKYLTGFAIAPSESRFLSAQP